MFEEGVSVIIEAPNFFKGKKIAVYLHPCKDHDNGHRCFLVDKSATVKEVCVNLKEKDNSMVLL